MEDRHKIPPIKRGNIHQLIMCQRCWSIVDRRSMSSSSYAPAPSWWQQFIMFLFWWEQWLYITWVALSNRPFSIYLFFLADARRSVSYQRWCDCSIFCGHARHEKVVLWVVASGSWPGTWRHAASFLHAHHTKVRFRITLPAHVWPARPAHWLAEI
jgi:hypothetical protein